MRVRGGAGLGVPISLLLLLYTYCFEASLSIVISICSIRLLLSLLLLLLSLLLLLLILSGGAGRGVQGRENPFVGGNFTPSKRESARVEPRISRLLLCESGVRPVSITANQSADPGIHQGWYCQRDGGSKQVNGPDIIL